MSEASILDRDAELERVESLLDDAERGAGRLLIVEGSPGIGKTTLLAHTIDRAGERGLRVLSARGSELEASFEFGAVHQLFDAPVRARTGELTGAAGLAASALGLGGTSAEPPGDPAFAVLHGLYWLTSDLAQASPLLLVVDDLQWIDPPSYRFLQFLERRLEGMKVAIVVARREGEGESNPVENIRSSATTETLNLEPLGAGAICTLVREALGDDLSDEFCLACLEATRGNPFMLRELIEVLRRALHEQPAAPSSVGAIGPVLVSATVLGRAARTPGAADLANAVAILGDGASISAASALTARDSNEVAVLADALADSLILERGGPLRFIHPIVRVAVHDAIAPATRSEMHRQAAELTREEGRPQIASAHLLKTDPRGDAEVVGWLRRAAAASLSSGAPESSIEYLRRALAEPPSADIRAQVLHELGWALSLVGKPEGLELLRESYEASPPRERTRVALSLADALQSAGELATAVGLLEEALGEVEAEDSELAGLLEGRLLPLACSGVSGRRLAGHRLVTPTDEADRRHGQLPSLAFERATGSRAKADEAAALALEAMEHEGYVATHWDAVFAIGAANALALSGRYADSERVLTDLIQRAGDTGSLRAFTIASTSRSWCRYLRGDLPGAEADARACFELAVEASWALLNPLVAATLSGVQIEAGDLEAARQTQGPFGPVATDADLGFSQLLHIESARLELAEGDAGASLARLEPCREFEDGWGRGAGIACAVPWRVPAVEALVQVGDAGAARALATEQLDAGREFGAARGIGVGLRALALVSQGSERVALLEEAVDVLSRGGVLVEQARSQFELGSALRRSGSRSRAREVLSESMDMAHRLGAAAIADSAREELVAAGSRPRRLAARGPESLTASERRVASMAAEGMKNREIAQALFVTIRTVEGHLSNAFRKLGIESRGGLAVALRQGDAVDRGVPG